jgi:ABC-type dipeptide/oligopeptide/nickel transport system permease component
LVPANPLATVLSQRELNNKSAVAAAKSRWGLDKVLPVQYVRYVENLARGDMGTSFTTKQNVRTDLAQRLPATMELTLAAMAIAIVAGVLIGVLVATRHDKLTDHLGRLFALVVLSTPVYLWGLILLATFSWPGIGSYAVASAESLDFPGMSGSRR